MRRMVMLLFGLGFLMVGAVGAEALTFTDTQDFSGSVVKGRTAQEIGNNSSPFNFPFTHNVSFVPPAASITSAQILLSHYDNSGSDTGELWFLYGDTSTPIGKLEQSNGSWNDQIFTLPSTLYSAISGGSWSLELILRESTSGNDKLWIDQSVLSGEYIPVVTVPDPPPNTNVNAVPEPSTVILLGAGMVAIAGLRARKKARG